MDFKKFERIDYLITGPLLSIISLVLSILTYITIQSIKANNLNFECQRTGNEEDVISCNSKREKISTFMSSGAATWLVNADIWHTQIHKESMPYSYLNHTTFSTYDFDCEWNLNSSFVFGSDLYFEHGPYTCKSVVIRNAATIAVINPSNDLAQFIIIHNGSNIDGAKLIVERFIRKPILRYLGYVYKVSGTFSAITHPYLITHALGYFEDRSMLYNCICKRDSESNNGTIELINIFVSAIIALYFIGAMIIKLTHENDSKSIQKNTIITPTQ